MVRPLDFPWLRPCVRHTGLAAHAGRRADPHAVLRAHVSHEGHTDAPGTSGPQLPGTLDHATNGDHGEQRARWMIPSIMPLGHRDQTLAAVPVEGIDFAPVALDSPDQA